MARITVEDCIKQVKNQYDLVILAKERTVQLGRGAAPAVDPENDKKPVIALREIGETKITPEELHDSIVNKLRQIPDYQEEEELEEVKDAINQKDKNQISMELGDLMFAVVNLSRFYNIDPENALKKSTNKFISRFNKIEKRISERGDSIESSDLETMDKIWNEIKLDEK